MNRIAKLLVLVMAVAMTSVLVMAEDGVKTKAKCKCGGEKCAKKTESKKCAGKKCGGKVEGKCGGKKCGSKPDMMKTMDTDGNGSLSLAEVKASCDKKEAMMKAKLGENWNEEWAAMMPSAEMIFAGMDLDGDGNATKEEMNSATKSLMGGFGMGKGGCRSKSKADDDDDK
jgi:hypothetical protein